VIVRCTQCNNTVTIDCQSRRRSWLYKS